MNRFEAARKSNFESVHRYSAPYSEGKLNFHRLRCSNTFVSLISRISCMSRNILYVFYVGIHRCTMYVCDSNWSACYEVKN